MATWAVGDVHGCLTHLERLWQRLTPVPSRDTVVFLGDLIDRGPDSRGVVEFILERRKKGHQIITIMGNHEYMLLASVAGDEGYWWNWGRNGAAITLLSYGIDKASEFPKLPREHLNFFREMAPFVWLEGKVLLTHAVPLHDPPEELALETLTWNRSYPPDGSPYPHATRVIHGHNPEQEVMRRANYTGIDTGAVGAYMGRKGYGKLTALCVETDEVIQVRPEDL